MLCRDDGAGVATVHRLQREREAPPGVLILDGGTLGLSLLPYLEDAKAAILVDAVRADAAPGSLVRIEGAAVGPAAAGRLSVHQIGVADLLDVAMLRGRIPPRLVLLGVVPETIGLGLELSPSVGNRLPELVDLVVEEAAALGFELPPRAPSPVATATGFALPLVGS